MPHWPVDLVVTSSWLVQVPSTWARPRDRGGAVRGRFLLSVAIPHVVDMGLHRRWRALVNGPQADLPNLASVHTSTLLGLMKILHWLPRRSPWSPPRRDDVRAPSSTRPPTLPNGLRAVSGEHCATPDLLSAKEVKIAPRHRKWQGSSECGISTATRRRRGMQRTGL